MRVAVFLTGALRTIDKTIAYFKKNILLGSNYHVYACLQNDSSKSNEEVEQWLKENIGENLKSLQWFDSNDVCWLQLRERLLYNIHIPENWINYLRNSGSMVEYYQLQTAYFVLSKYELENRFRYNYVIRCRTDTIFTKPIDFHWLNWSHSDINERVSIIKNKLNDKFGDKFGDMFDNKGCDTETLLKYFMTTILYSNSEIYEIFDKISIEHLISGNEHELQEYFKMNSKDEKVIEFLKNYLNHGRYILTFRANLLYIVHRDMFNVIPTLGSFYGYFIYPTSDPYWFNAECQFRGACFQSGVSYFDYQTDFECNSLYDYNKDNYFDPDYNLKTNLMLFCLIRN